MGLLLPYSERASRLTMPRQPAMCRKVVDATVPQHGHRDGRRGERSGSTCSGAVRAKARAARSVITGDHVRLRRMPAVASNGA